MLFQESVKFKFAAKIMRRFLAAEARNVTDNLRKAPALIWTSLAVSGIYRGRRRPWPLSKSTEVSKRYNHTVAVKSCDLQVHSGEILALLGPSGSGKTTLLRLIAGFERPDEGRILIGERTVVDVASSVWLPAEERGVGMVFQDYALFPHLTVTQNVHFGLRNGNKSAVKAALKNCCD